MMTVSCFRRHALSGRLFLGSVLICSKLIAEPKLESVARSHTRCAQAPAPFQMEAAPDFHARFMRAALEQVSCMQCTS